MHEEIQKGDIFDCGSDLFHYHNHHQNNPINVKYKHYHLRTHRAAENDD